MKYYNTQCKISHKLHILFYTLIINITSSYFLNYNFFGGRGEGWMWNWEKKKGKEQISAQKFQTCNQQTIRIKVNEQKEIINQKKYEFHHQSSVGISICFSISMKQVVRPLLSILKLHP